MEPWIVATLAAAAFQTLRFALHKVLSLDGLSATGSTLTRFVYAMPFAWGCFGLYLWLSVSDLPALGAAFWVYAPLGAIGQILATVCVVALFEARNFAVGITFKKTEVIQTAILGVIVLGEAVSPGGWMAILIGLVGVLLLSETPGLTGRWWQRIAPRAVALGLTAGFFFAVSAVGYRGATLAVASEDAFLRAVMTLSIVTLMQSSVLGLWLRMRAPGTLAAVWAARRRGVWLGFASMAGSLGWFTAFTLQTAAYVQALGQVELIFSIAVSALVFRETITRREIAGMGALALSILALIAAL
ncbi:EamA/RhaT family transporter [Roseivivax sp. CAU 1753]